MSYPLTNTPHRRPLGHSSAGNTPGRSFGQPLVAPAQQLSESQTSQDSFSAYVNHASGSSSPPSQTGGKKLRRAPFPRPHLYEDDDDAYELDATWPRTLKSNTHLLSSQETESDSENAPPDGFQGAASRPLPRPALASATRYDESTGRVPPIITASSTAESTRKTICISPTSTQDSGTSVTSSHFRASTVPTSSPIRRGAPMELPPLYDGPSESQNHLSQSALEPYHFSSSGSRPSATEDDADASAPSGTQGTAEILGSSATTVPRTFAVDVDDDDDRMELGDETFDGEDDDEDQLRDEMMDASYSHRSQRDLDDDAFMMDDGDDVDDDLRDGMDGRTDAGANDSSGAGENGRKRRRRTNQTEARVLASVFEQTAFPDLDTRTKLAKRLDMSLRSVSIWFQNRRQAMKKRSTRYGGPEGVAGLRPSEYPYSSPVGIKVEERVAALPSFSSSEDIERPVLFSSSSSAATKAAPVMPPTSSVATTTTTVMASGTRTLRLTSPRPSPAARSRISSIGGALSSEPTGPIKDLRDLVTGRFPLDTLTSRGGLSRSVSLSSFDSVSQRSFSRPPLSRKPSLNDVMQLYDEPQHVGLSTARPPMSDKSSHHPLSLSISTTGRAAIDLVDSDPGAESQRPCSKRTTIHAALASRLPPAVANALRKQGVIATAASDSSSLSSAPPTDDGRGESVLADAQCHIQPVAGPRTVSHIWERMVSSSSSSDGPFAVDVRQRGADTDEEDEERTLRLIATRRAAKAQAKAKAELLSSRVLAAEADATASASHTALGARPAEKMVVAPSGRRFRLPTLDMAAGRDRACDASARAKASSLMGSVTNASADDCDDIIDDDEVGALLSRKRPRFGMDYDWGVITAQVHVRSEEQRARQAVIAAAKAKARRAQNARAARRTLEAQRAHERMQQIEDEERTRASTVPEHYQMQDGIPSSSVPSAPQSPFAFEQAHDLRGAPTQQSFIDEAGHRIAEGLYESEDSYARPGLHSTPFLRTRSIPDSSSSNGGANGSSLGLGQRFSASSSRESGPPNVPSLNAVEDKSASMARYHAAFRGFSASLQLLNRVTSLAASLEARNGARRTSSGSSGEDWARPSSFTRGDAAAAAHMRSRPHSQYPGSSNTPGALRGPASAFRRTVSEANPRLNGRSSLSGPSPSSRLSGRGVLSASQVSPPQQQVHAPVASSPVLANGKATAGHDDSGFFGSDSEEGGDENTVKGAYKDRNKVSSSPANGTRRAASSSPTKGHPDRQAAELLLGLGREG